MAGPVYLADPPEASKHVVLEGLVTLFHKPSGMTHILAPPAPQILAALASEPAGLDELGRRLAKDFQVTGEEAELEARLGELIAAGLVRRL